VRRTKIWSKYGRKMTDTDVRQIKRCSKESRTKKDEKRQMICVGEMSALHANECRETGSDLPRNTNSRTSDKSRGVGKSEGRKYGRKMTDTDVRQIKRCRKVRRTKNVEKGRKTSKKDGKRRKRTKNFEKGRKTLKNVEKR
jgi:hypothetical protein